MVFHEITKPAIQAAVANPREIDRALVDAQEARRILDRLYGYEVSPVLWKKVMPRLSAGRVQSVATRIVVERERQRMEFRSAEYWDILAKLPAGTATTRTFNATLIALDGDRVATGRDFDPETGKVRPDAGVVHLDEQGARGLAARLDGPAVHGHPGRGEAVPAQAVRAVHHLHAAAGGLPQAAVVQRADHAPRAAAVRERLHHLYAYRLGEPVRGRDRRRPPADPQLYGPAAVPPQPRRYTGKVKNAQEAHEAIRPAGDSFRTPGEVAKELSAEEFRLYELIWRRTIASQMTDAVGNSTSVRIQRGDHRREECRLQRDRQDDHRPRLPARPTSSPPTTRTRRPRTPSAGCRCWSRASR